MEKGIQNRLMGGVTQTIILLILSAVLGAGINVASESPISWVRVPLSSEDERWSILNADDVLEHLRNGTAIIIDARNPERYRNGHIEGALNIPQSTFEESFLEMRDFLPRELLYIAYCDASACSESIYVLIQMHEFGFRELALYEQGWLDWVNQDYPIDVGS